MAADWIKMRADLLTHPKVVRMMSALKADKFRTVGGLLSAWCLFDAHSIDGRLSGYTLDALDAMAAWPGFAAAMVAVDWLIVESADGVESILLPRFEAHNGQSAKRRAQEADRKRNDRKTSASDADTMRTREEKRREEKKEKKEKKEQEQEHAPQASASVPSKRGSRLPDDWRPDETELAWAASACPGIDARREAEKFRDYWRAKAGKDGVKLDWSATFRNWLRNAKPASTATPFRQQFEPISQARRPLS